LRSEKLRQDVGRRPILGVHGTDESGNQQKWACPVAERGSRMPWPRRHAGHGIAQDDGVETKVEFGFFLAGRSDA
jgi:hypothetical protein